MWLDMGMNYFEIDDYTLAELHYIIDNWLDSEKSKRKWEAQLAFWTVSTLTLGYHDPKKLPRQARDVFPDLFDEVAVDEELMQQRFLAGARRHNKNIKEE